MTKLTLVAVVSIIAAASAAIDIHPLSDEYIALINQKAKTWKAGKNFEIHEWERVKRIGSDVLPRDPNRKSFAKVNPHDEYEDVPENFDAREFWPKCDSIKQIADQSECGAGWAFGAVGAMSDRICIQSNQTKQVYVSAEDVVSCCQGSWQCGYGCLAGEIELTWIYWKRTGFVTGGLYNSSQGCKDYSLAPCEHYVDGGSRPQCTSGRDNTPICVESCYNSSINYTESRTYGQEVHSFTKQKQIQLEIYKHGPVESGFAVHEDFPSYKSGVYQTTTKVVVGEHAVKIIGWGVENGTAYWLAANSWNTDWGDKGFFKILRGENHCKIETQVFSSLPVA